MFFYNYLKQKRIVCFALHHSSQRVWDPKTSQTSKLHSENFNWSQSSSTDTRHCTVITSTFTGLCFRMLFSAIHFHVMDDLESLVGSHSSNYYCTALITILSIGTHSFSSNRYSLVIDARPNVRKCIITSAFYQRLRSSGNIPRSVGYYNTDQLQFRLFHSRKPIFKWYMIIYYLCNQLNIFGAFSPGRNLASLVHFM